MDRNDFIWLAIILLIAAAGAWVVQNPDYPIRQGLDLQGGLQVLLEADLDEDQEVTSEQMNTSRQIIDQRVNALGVAEPLVQVEGDRRILVELPGIENPEEAISLIQETALLEFVNTGEQSLPEGFCIRTTLNNGEPSRCELGAGIPITTVQEAPAPTYETIMTGAELRTAESEADQFGNYYVAFSLQPEAADLFADYTRENQGRFLTIVLDKQVISSPRISAVIDQGQGTITGQFSQTPQGRGALCRGDPASQVEQTAGAGSSGRNGQAGITAP